MREIDTELISLKQLCESISISPATGKNWLKLGKITPQHREGKEPLFTREYAERLKDDISSGKMDALKSRRNKKYLSGNFFYHSYVADNSENIAVIRGLLDEIAKREVALDDAGIQFLLAECAIQLILQAAETESAAAERESTISETEGATADSAVSAVRGGQGKNGAGSLAQYLAGETALSRYPSDGESIPGYPLDGGSLSRYQPLVDALLADREGAKAFIEKYPSLFSVSYTYGRREDCLGLLYLSCKNISSRKAAGAYYTPTTVVKKMVEKLVEKLCPAGEGAAGEYLAGKKILDPCCGTGNFLLQLPDGFALSDVYGNDCDAVSVKVARINLALKYQPGDCSVLYKNITSQDFLCQYQESGFDYILGNPPWGYEFDEKEKAYLRNRFVTAQGKKIESYDVFLEKALYLLKENGMLSFLLPEAVMNVKAHLPVRQVIGKVSAIRYLYFLGNVFDRVWCPCMIMQLQYTGKPMDCVGLTVNDGKREYRIAVPRKINPECFNFHVTDEEQAVMDKIMERSGLAYLAENAVFALGIVTGDNKKYVSAVKTKENERVVRGADICRYKVNSGDMAGKPGHFIVYRPEAFQQSASSQYYRADEKLLYRFISSQLVFAYDDRQTLTLNSCNIVIPQIEGMKIKYIMALFNSRIAQFIFQKKFHSVKVLREHIEQIPLPRIGVEEQKEYEEYADRLALEYDREACRRLYDELDRKVADLFCLTKEEYGVVLQALQGKNLFL